MQARTNEDSPRMNEENIVPRKNCSTVGIFVKGSEYCA